MTPKDANAVAVLMRRTHGPMAEQFISTQILRFQSESNRHLAVAAWEMVGSEVEKLRAADRRRRPALPVTPSVRHHG
jgi:hypothetical protein